MLTVLSGIFALTAMLAHADAPETPVAVEPGGPTLVMLKAVLTQLSETKDVKIETVTGSTAMEYRVYYHPSDEGSIRGLGGITQTSITTLLNELSIAEQRDAARAAHHDFDIRHRKFLLVRFVKLEN